MIGQKVPDTVFHTRVRNDALGGPNPYEWRKLTSADVFAGRNIVLFALPGAFTPACSESHLPGYEANYDAFTALGVDEVVCLSVNDAFTMFQWGRAHGISRVFMLPDGNGDFTRLMGMLVSRRGSGMGYRSWRYSMHVVDGGIRQFFAEPGFRDEPEGVPVDVSAAGVMLEALKR